MNDRAVHDLVAYAKKVEKDFYKMANSQSEYNDLMTERIEEISKELQRKQEERRQQNQHQMPANSFNSRVAKLLKNLTPIPPQNP